MADLKLQPFELSLWKDKVFTEEPEYSAEENLKYKNVYRGLGTDEKDLSFWFLPRKWNGAKFIPDEDDPINKVIVDIAPPQERTTSLVHADFSTSCLDFKPNTYYTFLLHLDFTVEGARLPDWSTYVAKKANVNKDNHYLISFIRKKIESSMWHMPPSIFNSSVAISFDEGGFNLENSELNEDYEDMRLFIHKDSGVVDHVLLLCSVKTNDFLTENNTLGLWSFFEAWADDYWKAGMEIYGFEDRLISYTPEDQSPTLVPESFKNLYFKITGNEDYVPSSLPQEIHLGGPVEDMPESWRAIKQNYGNSQSVLFNEIKEKVDTVIKQYYKELFDGIAKGYTEEVTLEEVTLEETTSQENPSQEPPLDDQNLSEDISDEISNSGKADFIEKYSNDGTIPIRSESDPNFDFNSILPNSFTKELSLKVAEIFYRYFPGLIFPYVSENDSSLSYFPRIEDVYTGNFTSYFSRFEHNGDKWDFIDTFCMNDLFLFPIYWEQTIQRGVEMKVAVEVEVEGETEVEMRLKTYDITTNSLYIYNKYSPNNSRQISSLSSEQQDTFVQEIIDRFWIRFFPPDEKSIIEQYLEKIYFSYSSVDEEQNDLYDFIVNDNNEITPAGIQILTRYGMTLSLFPKFEVLLSKLDQLYLKNLDYTIPNSNYTSAQWSGRGKIVKDFLPFFLIGLQTLEIRKDTIQDPTEIKDTIKCPHFYINAAGDLGTINKRVYIVAFQRVFTEMRNKNIENSEEFNHHLKNLFKVIQPEDVNSFDFWNNEQDETSILLNIINEKKEKQYIKECKQLIFGNQEGHPSYAQNISFVEGTKDAMHTLTFSLYDSYYNEYGKKEQNYFIDLLHEEDKIKLKYNNKWYDFIITDTNKDTVEHKVDYIAKDANVIELSKIGFNKTFNTELDNNVGTIDELASLAIQGTNWKLNENEQNKHKFHQGVLKPVIKGILKQDISVQLNTYYYNRNLEKQNLEEPIILNNEETIYVFIDDFKESNEEKENNQLSFKIICTEDFSDSFEIVNNQLINVCLYPNFLIYQQGIKVEEINTTPYYLEQLGMYVTLPDIFQNESPKELVFDYTLRGEDIVTKPYTHYSVPLKRYVMEYKDTEDDDKILYGYVKSEYTTTPLVQNLIPNGEDFTSTDGWITGTTNHYTTMKPNLGATIKNNDMSTIKPYIQFNSKMWRGYAGCHGFTCNTELGYNFAEIRDIKPGDEFILRVQVERNDDATIVTPSGDTSNIENNLYLMSALKPYIYEYNSVLSLQSNCAKDILPTSDKQILNFIQDHRYVERAKINSKLESTEINLYDIDPPSYANRSIFDKYTYNLKDVLDIGDYTPISRDSKNALPQGLVPIYLANFSKISLGPEETLAPYTIKPLITRPGIRLPFDYYYDYYDTGTFETKTYYHLNDGDGDTIPFAYIPESLAKKWSLYEIQENVPYGGNIYRPQTFSNRGAPKFLIPFDAVEETHGYNYTKYYLTHRGMEQLARFLAPDFNSSFYLKDFSIMSNIGVTITDNPWSYSFSFLKNSNSIQYYLPMLFTTGELIDIIFPEEDPEEETLTIEQKSNIINKHFFQNGFTSDINHSFDWNWEEIMKNKEYYGYEKEEQTETIYPYNININFSDQDDETINIIDFDSLMRMRMHWYPVQYSKTDACIFEASGTYFGKPIKINENNYEFVKGANGPLEYTHEDLLTKNLGLFFIFGATLLDTSPATLQSLSLSKIELFRKHLTEKGELLLPNKILESNTTPIYYLYDNEENTDVIKEEDMKYKYIGSYVPERYELNIDLTGEKKNSITITESNVYNILQKLAEIFDAYLVIEVNHNENGEILEREGSENHELDKNIYFIDSDYTDNFSGIKYGINLQKITRKIDSNDLITKLIVKNNSNEFGKNGFCSIARSKYNLSGSNSIFNLDYLITMGIITPELKEKLYKNIYPRTRAYGQFLAELIDHRAKQSIIASQTKAEADFNKLILNEAKRKMDSTIDEYNSLTNVGITIDGETSDSVGIGYYVNNEEAKKALPSEAQKIINTAIFYMNLVTGYNAKYKNSIITSEDAERDYETSKDITESITVQRDSLLNEFQLLAGGRIKEGAWSSEDYIDDDLYYLDGERQLRETSVPKVSYTIEIADISSLPGYEGYKFNLRDKTTIEDPEMFGYDSNGTPNKEEIIISEKTSYLQSPDKNTITVQNYKTKFEDLFQRMASTIKAVEFGTLNYTNKNSTNSIENRVESNETDLRAIKIYNNL